MVVVADVLLQTCRQLFYAFKSFQVEKLGLKRTKKAFHRSVVQAISLTRHALLHTLYRQFLTVLRVLILPALIRVHHKLRLVLQLLQRLVQHTGDQLKARPGRQFVRHDLTVVQVHHRREIQLSIGHFKLGHIGHPFLVRALRREIALQQIRCNFSDGALIGTVFFWSNNGAQTQFSHQFLHNLLVDQRA
ncbi:hypothetical protein ALQ34_200100 [Pseudomonas syringae pv. maculicola]|nr:hypothetical protein ALQ34_200100 [Pseudomonas syringae pv. maculicola]